MHVCACMRACVCELVHHKTFILSNFQPEHYTHSIQCKKCICALYYKTQHSFTAEGFVAQKHSITCVHIIKYIPLYDVETAKLQEFSTLPSPTLGKKEEKDIFKGKCS